jgi:chromosome segregation ATPase
MTIADGDVADVEVEISELYTQLAAVTRERDEARAERHEAAEEADRNENFLADMTAERDRLCSALDLTEANINALAADIPERALATGRTAAWAVLAAIRARAGLP